MKKTMDIIIETPKGSSEKYTYDKKSGLFRLKKILATGMMFPFDFGFIPGTKGEDGDPLDAMVISEFKSFPGCLLECRLIGALLAEQESDEGKVRNDRYFFVPVLSKQFGQIKSINDIPGDQVSEIKDFFIQYNKMEGKIFKPLGLESPKGAMALLK